MPVSDPFDLPEVRLGLAYEACGARREAIAAYRSARKADPDGWAANFLLGLHALAEAEWEDAFRSFVAVTERAPACWQGVHNLGLVYWQQNDRASAHRCWERALGLESRSGPSMLNLGVSHVALGRLDEAQRSFERAIRSEVRPLAQTNLGALLAATGSRHDARACFERAISDREDPASLRNLARLFILQDQGPEADRCVARAAQLSAGHDAVIGDFHYRLAVALRPGTEQAPEGVEDRLGDPLVTWDLDRQEAET